MKEIDRQLLFSPFRLVFLFWSFHRWYEQMSNTCYIFSSLFLFHWFSQIVINFTLTPETSVSLLLLIFQASHATKKLNVKIVEPKLGEAFFDGKRRIVQLGRFILLNVQFLNNFPDL